LLNADGPAYGLALDKKNALEANQPCVFLDESDDGTSRCGVYDDRPIASDTIVASSIRFDSRDRTAYRA